jgi:hypothetical protein
MSGWPFRWSEGIPAEAGTYLVCWHAPDTDFPTTYVVYEYDGNGYGREFLLTPTHWQRVTSPAEDIEMMNEYETT